MSKLHDFEYDDLSLIYDSKNKYYVISHAFSWIRSPEKSPKVIKLG